MPPESEEPLDTTAPPAPVDSTALPDAPPDRIPSAEPLDGVIPDDTNAPPPAETKTDTPPADDAAPEPAYVAEMKAQLKAQADEIATLKGKPAEPKTPVAPYEPTPEQWSAMEKDFGFSYQDITAEDGTIKKSLNVAPKQLIKTIFAQFENLAKNLRAEFDGRLHENTADSRMDRAFYDMEKRPSSPFTDIRQHSKDIKEYLHKFYNGQPQKWSDPDVLEAAYWVAVAKRSRQKPVAPARTDVRVIHPGTGKPAAKPVANNTISPQEREMMRGMRGRDGKPITDAEWIFNRGGTPAGANGR